MDEIYIYISSFSDGMFSHELINLQEFEKTMRREHDEMVYREHMKEQDWLIEIQVGGTPRVGDK